MALVFAGRALTLMPEQYTHMLIGDDGSRVCQTAFQSQTSQLWVIGDAFLRAFYSIYDRTGMRIGLAESKPDAIASLTSHPR